jgi:hypothetical protein
LLYWDCKLAVSDNKIGYSQGRKLGIEGREDEQLPAPSRSAHVPKLGPGGG